MLGVGDGCWLAMMLSCCGCSRGNDCGADACSRTCSGGGAGDDSSKYSLSGDGDASL